MLKDKSINRVEKEISKFDFNFGKFIFYSACNVGAIFLGSLATLAVALVVYAINLKDLASFDIYMALKSVGYDWLYNDVLASVLTLSAALVITYIVSFRKEAEEYLGGFSVVVSCLAAICVLLCFFMIALEIIYALYVSNNNGVNIGSLSVYNVIGMVSLLVCGFLQTFSHPEYYMSPRQF